MNEQPCMQCGGKLKQAIYAVYRKVDRQEEANGEEEIAGFLCDDCRGKQRIKGLRNVNELHNLEQLKKLLNS